MDGDTGRFAAPLVKAIPMDRDTGRFAATLVKAIPMDGDVERFAATLVESMADAVIYADAEGIVRFWNPGAERMFGFAQAEAVGHSLDIIVPQNLRQRHWEGFNET